VIISWTVSSLTLGYRELCNSRTGRELRSYAHLTCKNKITLLIQGTMNAIIFTHQRPSIHVPITVCVTQKDVRRTANSCYGLNIFSSVVFVIQLRGINRHHSNVWIDISKTSRYTNTYLNTLM
jgi:hypothetical protein